VKKLELSNLSIFHYLWASILLQMYEVFLNQSNFISTYLNKILPFFLR
jgi:hypothetical protein